MMKERINISPMISTIPSNKKFSLNPSFSKIPAYIIPTIIDIQRTVKMTILAINRFKS